MPFDRDVPRHPGRPLRQLGSAAGQSIHVDSACRGRPSTTTSAPASTRGSPTTSMGEHHPQHRIGLRATTASIPSEERPFLCPRCSRPGKSNKAGESKNVADCRRSHPSVRRADDRAGQLLLEPFRRGTDRPLKLLSVVDPSAAAPALYRREPSGQPNQAQPVRRGAGASSGAGHHRRLLPVHDGRLGGPIATVELRYRFGPAPPTTWSPTFASTPKPPPISTVSRCSDGDPIPDHASADYRLGELDGRRSGSRYGHPFGEGKSGASGRGVRAIGACACRRDAGALEAFDLYSR